MVRQKINKKVFKDHEPDIVMHLAAESHVDRSIDGPGEFIQTFRFPKRVHGADKLVVLSSNLSASWTGFLGTDGTCEACDTAH